MFRVGAALMLSKAGSPTGFVGFWSSRLTFSLLLWLDFSPAGLAEPWVVF
jgi:hypothetical protein